MTLEANDLLLFSQIADSGSFSRAADRAGLPKSTVSRRLAALEARLGERLLLRTTRKLTVTDFGHIVLEHARQIGAEVQAAASLAQHRQIEPAGRLRVSMPSDFANIVLPRFLVDFAAKFPAIALELDLTARRVDLIGENFDCAIRFGELSDDASLAARRLAVFSHGLYASPGYVSRRGVPSEPEALMEHDALRLLARTGEPVPWVLTRGQERWEGVPPGRATANSPEILLRLAQLGAGITIAAHHFVEPYAKAGELIEVLADWKLPVITAWAVFPGRRLMPARTRAFLDALQAVFSSPACQAQQAEDSKPPAVRGGRSASIASVRRGSRN